VVGLLQDELPQQRARHEPLEPFLKWAGGKRRAVPALLARAPRRFGTYYEPFLGGGALYFALRPARAILSDINDRLIRTYRGVRNSTGRVVQRLGEMQPSLECFLQTRARDIDCENDAEVASWLIFLNRTAYNGLYRVNRRGRFNVPFGRYKAPTVCRANSLWQCAAALEQADVRVGDFESILSSALPGDLVYCDPPYVPLSVTASFTRYASHPFTLTDHVRLRDVALRLRRRGVHVILTNSIADSVFDLYERDFRIEIVQAARSVNCNGNGRGPIGEVIITPK
jgi:DNA adenine methylase